MKHTAKHIVTTIILLLICVSTLTGCANDSVMGSWKLTGCATSDGNIIPAEEFGNMELKIKSNGEVIIVTDDSQQTSAWFYEGELLVIDSMVSQLEGNTLTMPLANIGILTFKRN